MRSVAPNVSGGWTDEKVRAYQEAYEIFSAQVYFDSKETGRTCLATNRYNSQKWFLQAIWEGLADNIHDFKFLKSRQLGCTTEARAMDAFWIGIHDGMRGATVFDTDGHKEEARIEIEAMIRNLPRTVKFPRVKTLNRYMMTLDNDSMMRFMSAGIRTSKSSGVLGRSSGINFLHGSEMCLAPETEILLADGSIKAIKDIVVNDVVLTGGGSEADVKDVLKLHNTKGMIRISPFFGPSVHCTGDHKILTARGLVEARHIQHCDRLVMPIRPIVNEVPMEFLPEHRPHPIYGGAVAVAAGASIVLNEELGFAVGYYLAEGNIRYTPGPSGPYHYLSGIDFARARDEGRYAERAAQALAPYTTKLRRIYQRRDSAGVSETIYGAAIARWIETKFGDRDDKSIPNEVFRWGKEFCRGLVAGLLSGDGSKVGLRRRAYHNNTVNLCSTRPMLAFQLRDLVGALGYGWGGVQYRDGGIRCGRICLPTWTISWSGRCALTLRELMDLPAIEIRKHKPPRYGLFDDHIEIDIRSIEKSENQPIVYDLCLDHPDHTFRTIGMTVSNCSWDAPEGIKALKQSLAEEYENRLYIWESTGRGFNDWHDMWQEALADDLNQRATFLGWWLKDTQIIRYGSPMWDRYGAGEPTEEENKRIAEVKRRYGWEVTREQLAWYRRKMDPARERDADDPEDSFDLQEQPWTEDECFQATGSNFFDSVKLSERMAQAVPHKYQAFKFWPGIDFFASTIDPARTWRETQIKLWEEPQPDATYIVAADPAYGHDEKNDRSAIQVLRCYADQAEQVCEYACASTPTHQFGWLIVAIGAYYGLYSGSAVYEIVELNGPGEAVWREMGMLTAAIRTGYYAPLARERGIGDMVNNIRQYVYTRSDAQTAGHSWHWKTTSQLKVAIMERVRDFIHNGRLLVRSQETLEEARSVTRDGDTIRAEGKKHDDRIFTLALAVRCWEERAQRRLMADNRTKAADTAKRALSMADQYRLHSEHMLTNFFKVKQQNRAMLQMQAMRQRWGRVRY